MERDLIYENNNIGYSEQYPEECGGGINCKNHEACGEVLPKWWFECKGNYLCTNCDIKFGKTLEFKENAECPICLQCKLTVSQPNCGHFACIDCFVRCYYGDNSGEPSFPYPEIEEEYFEDMENPKWQNYYPLIHRYNVDWENWDANVRQKYDEEKNLRQCPLCRK
jgi:hypothetical protein